MKNAVKADLEEPRGEYDFSAMKGGVRGKYVQRYQEGTNLVLLAPDVAAVFTSDDAVNDALRSLMNIASEVVPSHDHE